MLTRFLLQVGGLCLIYALAMLATLPFMVYFGQPKPWQKAAEFLFSFPLDSQRLGLFSLTGGALVVLLNGLLWGTFIVGLVWVIQLVIGSLLK
jgi:uncharacterized protein YjeT (DUF2065 family)